MRSLAIPHRAFRHSRIAWFDAAVGLAAATATAVAGSLFRQRIWDWQLGTWIRALRRLGIVAGRSGTNLGWGQGYLMVNTSQMLLITGAVLLATYLVLRSNAGPTLKGLWMVGAIPLFLYFLVSYMRGVPPEGALNHIGAEWLYGEVCLWFLIAVLYLVFIFPVPLPLVVKLLSLVAVMGMSVVWRTATPVAYILISYYSRGVAAIPAWMALGPWGDFLYIIPMFAITLTSYRGGVTDAYRT